MGKFIYNSEVTVDFEDRLLAHLQLAIGTKLRRGESFFFSWKDNNAGGDGRSTVWMHPAVPIRFKFLGSRQVHINRSWVEAFVQGANSQAGLAVIAEPTERVS